MTNDTKNLFIDDIKVLRQSFLGWYYRATNGNPDEQLNAMTVPLDYIPLGCLLIEKIREKLTGQKIYYLITSELQDSAKDSKGLIRAASITDIKIVEDSDFIYKQALPSQLYQSQKHQQIKISYNKAKESVIDTQNAIYEKIIQNRVQYIKNWYENSQKTNNFETYYGINNKQPNFNQFESPIKIQMSNQERLKYWMKKINNENTNLKTVLKDGERVIAINLDKNNQTTLYAKVKNFNGVYSMIINQGHLYEGLLHGAASLRVNFKKEFENIQAEKSYKYTSAPKYNIDEAMIAAQGQDPFFQRGDVIFNFWDSEKNKIQSNYYQAKKNNASISISTIVNIANSLYNVLTSDFLTPETKTNMIIDFFIKDKNKMDKLEKEAYKAIKERIPLLLNLDIDKN